MVLFLTKNVFIYIYKRIGYLNYSKSIVQGATLESGSSSQAKQYQYLTPAKRNGIPIKDLLAEFDEMSETKVSPQFRIKMEESELSG